MADKNKQPAQFKLRVDIQCGVCGSLTHHSAGESVRGAPAGMLPSPAPFPKFCPCCGAAMERFCLKCHKKADMFFEEWWPEDDECMRTYTPAKRCSGCNAQLSNDAPHACQSDHGYQN